jgi:DNA-binding transcriptional LysR family regulator
MIDLRRLEYFVAVAEELHFSRAAARLGIAQPPLSQQIQKLEAEVGAQLFDRSHRAVALTTAGRALLPEARTLLAMSERVAGIARAVQDGRAGRLRLGLTGSTAFRLVPTLLRHYRSEYPDVVIQLSELPTADQVEQLADGRLDAGLTRAPILGGDLASVIVWSEALLVVLPADHALAGSAAIAVSELAAEPFVLFPRERGPGLYELVSGLCAEAGFAPKVVQEAVQMQTLVGLVAAGFGVSIVPASVRDFRLHGVVYRELQRPAPQSRIALVWNPALTSATRDRFIELASGHAASAGAASQT